MNQYFRNSEYQETAETLFLVVLILLVFLALIIIRNWYNLYKKRSFRRKNNKLLKQLNALKINLDSHVENQKTSDRLEEEISAKQIEILELQEEKENYKQKFYETLNAKDREIELHKESINHQKKAYERYVNFKSVEANNTRLGAHFMKNVISQIYDDLETLESNYYNFLGIRFQFIRKDKKLPSIKALKNIFKLLDYNVAALNKDNISLQEELEHIQMFLELINYLKPNAKIELNNALNKELYNALRIKPTLFFPFVENALKHGKLNQADSFISIDLKELKDQKLSYCVVNSAENYKDNLSSNFGLNALKQLLDAYYPGSKLEHNSLPNQQYMSQLILNLNK